MTANSWLTPLYITLVFRRHVSTFLHAEGLKVVIKQVHLVFLDVRNLVFMLKYGFNANG